MVTPKKKLGMEIMSYAKSHLHKQWKVRSVRLLTRKVSCTDPRHTSEAEVTRINERLYDDMGVIARRIASHLNPKITKNLQFSATRIQCQYGRHFLLKRNSIIIVNQGFLRSVVFVFPKLRQFVCQPPWVVFAFHNFIYFCIVILEGV